MDVVTYSLKDGEGTSDRYDREVAAFTDIVLGQARVMSP